jgi:hypothetical protein
MPDQQSRYQSGKSKLTLRVRLILTAAIILIYGAACSLPALVFSCYYPGNDSPPATDVWFGLAILGLGWMSLFFGCVAWLANIGVTFVSAWILLLAPRSALPPVPSELATK